MNTAEFLHRHLNRSGEPSPVALAPTFTRRNLAKLFRALGYTYGAEVGVADGRHALMLCQTVPELRLIGVDPWVKYRRNPRGGPQIQHDKNKRLAAERLAPFSADLRQLTSMDAVTVIPERSLDFVYIDGHHGFDYVAQDIIEWGKRVRVGGIISGHDYYAFKWAGVIEAVNAYTTAHHVEEWYVSQEREPTWFFSKTADAFPHRGW